MRPGDEAMDIHAAYRHCEEITWSQARNFSYGIRLLPPAKRQALSAVYACARRIDDIGDGDLPKPDKLAALADAARRFAIPLAAFGELIDGCEADVRGTTYRTFDDLLHYCRCVAGSIGRLSLGVFGTDDPQRAAPLADSLGVALQLTNILRDIREDYASGRVYLPAEDFERFGCSLDSLFKGPAAAGHPEPGHDAASSRAGPVGKPGGNGSEGKLVALVEFEAERARRWYDRGLTLMPLLDRRSAASAGAMAGIYFRLLEHITATPAAVLSRRVSLSAGEKALVAVRSLAATVVRPPRPRRSGPSSPAGVIQ